MKLGVSLSLPISSFKEKPRSVDLVVDGELMERRCAFGDAAAGCQPTYIRGLVTQNCATEADIISGWNPILNPKRPAPMNLAWHVRVVRAQTLFRLFVQRFI